MSETAPTTGAAGLAPAVTAAVGLVQQIGPRVERRPTLRFGTLVSVLGAIVALVGALQMAGSSTAGLIVVSLALCAGGYYLVWTFRSGPLAAAGAAASAAALPLVFVGLFSLGSTSDAMSGSSINGVVFLSLVGWIAAYAVGPGRGHVVYATLALVGVAGAAIAVVGGGLVEDAGYVLDRHQVSGLATAFVGVGVGLAISICVLGVAGILGVLGSDAFADISGSGSSSRSRSSSSAGIGAADLLFPGLLMIPGGVLMIRFGVGLLRRATAFGGAVVTATGLFLLSYALFSTSAAALSMLLLVLGGAAVFGGHWVSAKLGEEGDLDPAPSFATVGLIDAVKSGRSVEATAGDPLIWRSFAGTPIEGAVPWQTAAPVGAPAPGWWQASDGNWYPPPAAE